MEVFHYIERCPHFRGRGGSGVGIVSTEVSSFPGVEIEEFHYIIQKCPHFRD